MVIKMYMSRRLHKQMHIQLESAQIMPINHRFLQTQIFEISADTFDTTLDEYWT